MSQFFYDSRYRKESDIADAIADFCADCNQACPWATSGAGNPCKAIVDRFPFLQK